MGAWHFVYHRLRRILPDGRRLSYVGRPEAASPAPGSYKVHQQEETELLTKELDYLRRYLGFVPGETDVLERYGLLLADDLIATNGRRPQRPPASYGSERTHDGYARPADRGRLSDAEVR